MYSESTFRRSALPTSPPPLLIEPHLASQDHLPMLTVNRLNAEIPSPSLHLLGSDAGLDAHIPPIHSSAADDGHNQTYRYDYDKLLPDIPPDAHTASPFTAGTYTSPPHGHPAPNQIAHTPMHSKSPVNPVVRLFTTSNSARAIPVRFSRLPLMLCSLIR